MRDGRSVRRFQALQQCSVMSPRSVKMRFDSPLSRMNCQMFSTGLRPAPDLIRAPAPDVIRGQGIWGQRQECDVFGHDQVLRQVPACLIEQQQGMT